MVQEREFGSECAIDVVIVAEGIETEMLSVEIRLVWKRIEVFGSYFLT